MSIASASTVPDRLMAPVLLPTLNLLFPDTFSYLMTAFGRPFSCALTDPIIAYYEEKSDNNPTSKAPPFSYLEKCNE